MCLKAFGTMHGQQSHGLRCHHWWRQHTASFEGANKRIGRGIATTPELQRHAQHRPQIGQHRVALTRWCGHCETGQHVAVGINGLQSVVGR